MLFIFSTPVLIRHLWQLKTGCFIALVSNKGYSIGKTVCNVNNASNIVALD